ncbi:MAG: helix-turn-helix transcriptional regulator [Bacteroidales bacterium]|nr:helix-turn-helix transcriptional regulator [Bacteroidales bacterium]
MELEPQAIFYLKKYGKRIRRKRKLCQQTIVNMAKILDTDQSRLSRIENGKINLTINEIYSIENKINEYLKKKHEKIVVF